MIGSAIGLPGSRVTVDVSIVTDGFVVNGVENEIELNPNALIASEGGQPLCDSTIEGFTAEFVPDGCFPPAGAGGALGAPPCTRVHFTVVEPDIADQTVLYTCTVQISEDALPNTTLELVCYDPPPPTPGFPVWFDPTEHRADCTNGTIFVVATLPPTATPTDTPTGPTPTDTPTGPTPTNTPTGPTPTNTPTGPTPTDTPTGPTPTNTPTGPTPTNTPTGTTAFVQAYVANSGDDTVSVIAIPANTVRTVIALHTPAPPPQQQPQFEPQNVAFGPAMGAARFVYVTNMGDNAPSLSEISVASDTVTRSSPPLVQGYPGAIGLAINPQGFAYITHSTDNVLFRVNTNMPPDCFVTGPPPNGCRAAVQASSSSPYGVAVSPVNGDVYVTDINVPMVRVFSGGLARKTPSIPVGPSHGIAISSEDRLLIVVPEANELAVVNRAPCTQCPPDLTEPEWCVCRVQVGPEPEAVAIMPGGEQGKDIAYVTNTGSNSFSVVDFSEGQAIPPAQQFPLPGSPFGIAFTPAGDHAYITGTSGVVWVVDTGTNLVETTINVGPLPRGIAIGPVVPSSEDAVTSGEKLSAVAQRFMLWFWSMV